MVSPRPFEIALEKAQECHELMALPVTPKGFDARGNDKSFFQSSLLQAKYSRCNCLLSLLFEIKKGC